MVVGGDILTNAVAKDRDRQARLMRYRRRTRGSEITAFAHRNSKKTGGPRP